MQQGQSAQERKTKENGSNIKHSTHRENEYDDDDDEDEDQETKKLRLRKIKLNGFSSPFSLFQILSWLMIFLEALWIFLVLRAFMSTDTTEHVIYLILHCISFGITLTFGFLACFTDPSDPLVAQQKAGVELPDSQRTHLCNICKVFVGSKTKHCGVCNRCVSDFDHHCQWLNNCVGKANYKFFVGFTSFIFITLLINISYTAYSLSLRNNDYYSYEYRTQHQSILNSSKNAFFGLSITALIFNILACVLSAELLIYHIWLKFTGITTYEHILQRRKRAEELKKLKQIKDHQENNSMPQVSQKSSKITVSSGNKTEIAMRGIQLQQLHPPEGQNNPGMNRNNEQMKNTGFTTPRNSKININIQNVSPIDNNKNQDITAQPLNIISTAMHADSSMEIEQQLFLNQNLSNFCSDKKDTPGRLCEKYSDDHKNMYIDNGLTQNQSEDKNSVLLSVRTKDSRAMIDIQKGEEGAQKEQQDAVKGQLKLNESKKTLGSQTVVTSQKHLVSQQSNKGQELEILNYQQNQSQQQRNQDITKSEAPQVVVQKQTKNQKNKIMPARA